MDCRRVRKSLMEYADGGLPEGRRDEVGRHLQACADCAALAEGLSLSGSAMRSLEPVEMPGEASARVFAAVSGGLEEKRAGGGFFRSPRVVATAGLVTAVLVGLAIVVGIVTGDRNGGDTTVMERGVTTQAVSAPAGDTGLEEQKDSQGAAELPLASLVTPVARATSNNYDEGSMKDMAENLEISDRFAERYTLSDAINMRTAFIEKLADEFVAAGGDGPMLEAMITFVQQTEPVLLPCYAEKALFSSEPVYIVALSAPPRSGTTKKLTRVEFWAFNPEEFAASPEQSLVWWGQSQK